MKTELGHINTAVLKNIKEYLIKNIRVGVE